MTGTESVQISEELYEMISTRLDNTQFDDASEYVEFILGEVLHEMDSLDDEGTTGVDTDQVEDRLKSLGYLDN